MHKRSFLLAGITLLAGFFLSLDLPVRAQVSSNSTVVISQVYGGGGNTGAPYRNDYVEIFNRGDAPVDLAGLTIQYASAAGSGTFGANSPVALSGLLQPGQYLLVQLAGGATGAVLPTPDIVGGTNLSGSTGKVALVNSRSGLNCNGSTGQPCSTAQLALILDLVGYGTANFFEGPARAPALSNSSAGFRLAGGCIDTNNNGADFAAAAPAPRNSASPLNVCGAPAMTINAGAPASAVQNEEFILTATVASAPSAPTVVADLTGFGLPAQQFMFDDGVTPDVMAGDNVFTTAVLPPNAGTQTGYVVAMTPSANATAPFTVTVVPPPTIYFPHHVQGTGAASPLTGQVLTVEGVVTGRKTNGYFIQSVSADADPMTSEGLFVFTSSAPAAAASVGAVVRVTGRVVEFARSSDRSGRTVTELSNITSTTAMGSADLPAAVDIAPFLNPSGPPDQLEALEGMLVSAGPFTATSGTNGQKSEANATSTSLGEFYAVLTGTPRPAREPGIEAGKPITCAAGAPCATPVFDTNPEVFMVDSDGLAGIPPVDISTGAMFGGAAGPLHYDFGAYSLQAQSPLVPVMPGMNPTAVTPPSPTQFTVASFNMERFYDTVNDPGSDVPLTPAALERRLGKASLAIRQHLLAPDVIGVQEVENIAVLQALAARVSSDAVTAGQPDPGYSAYLLEGNDIGGIDVGFLVRSRVAVSEVTQWKKDEEYTFNGGAALLNDRPSLSIRVSIPGPAGRLDASAYVVTNHLRSLNGIDDPAEGARVRAKRAAQAESLADILQQLQVSGVPVISVGDYNAFEVNDGYVDSIATLLGTPTPADQVAIASPDLVEPDFVNVTAGDYSYVFGGNAQSLDHVLVSRPAFSLFAGQQHARINADFPEILRSDASLAARLSDHDPVVTYFEFPPDTVPPAIYSVTASRTSLWPANHALVPVEFDVQAADNAGPVSCSVSGVTSSEPDNGPGDGDTTGDWEVTGPFSVRLRAERAGTGDGRTYTVTVTCSDVAGNDTAAAATVVVPKSQKK